MDNRLVSILIPVYNREKYISETVKSALNQTYKNIEIIVVDNKSSDSTWKILKKLANEDGRIKIFQNETNIGPVRNWKRCLDEAQGEYGKILWSDDLIAPEFLEKTIHFLENKDVGFVFTGTEIFFEGSDRKQNSYFIGASGLYKSESFIQGILSNKGYPVSPGCALFRLSDLEQSLLIDIPNRVSSNFSQHAIGNDLLIYLLITLKYDSFAFVNEKLSYFRAHKDSISIQSEDGKLSLHYNLALAYFVENFRIDLIEKLNTNIWLTIKMNKVGAQKYFLNKIDNYYMKNKKYNISIIHLLKKISLLKRIRRIFNKLFK